MIDTGLNEKEDIVGIAIRFLSSTSGQGGIEDGAFGALVPRFNGFLSAIGWILVIVILWRSHDKLSSTYHRIIFAISLNGLFTSIAIGCTYWLFPKGDEILSWPYLIDEDIHRFGSVTTCEIQGAVIVSGYYVLEAYVASLCLYYLCAIVLRLKPETITKRIEWFLHLSPVLAGLVPAVLGLKTKSFNPSDSTPWCSFTRYPAACPKNCWTPYDEGCECIRGSLKYDRIYYNHVYTFLLYIHFSIIFSSLFAICMSAMVAIAKLILKKNRIRKRKDGLNSYTEYDEETMHIIHFRVDSHKATLLNALLYISATVIIFISLIMTKNLSPQSGHYEALKGIGMFSISSQGIVFFFIFLFINVRNVRESDPDLCLRDAVKMVFKKPSGAFIMVNVELLLSNTARRRSLLQMLEEQGSSLANDLLTLNTPNGAFFGSCRGENEDEELSDGEDCYDGLSHAASINLEGFHSYGSFMGKESEESCTYADFINDDVEGCFIIDNMFNRESYYTGDITELENI